MLSFPSKWPHRWRTARDAALLFPLNYLVRALDAGFAEQSHKGISLTDSVAEQHKARMPFLYALIVDALRLIERHDARRFRRVQRETRIIRVEYRQYSLATYQRFFRSITMNFAIFRAAEACGADGEDYEWFVAKVATILVHEATHGALFSRSVPYTKATRVRVERLCHREEQRFAARLPPSPYDHAANLVSPFDAANWEMSWRSPLRQRIAFEVALLRDKRASRAPLSEGSLSAAFSEFRTDGGGAEEGADPATAFRADASMPPLFSRLPSGALGPKVAPKNVPAATVPSFLLQADAPLSKKALPHPLAFSFADTLVSANRVALHKAGLHFGERRTDVTPLSEATKAANTAKPPGLG